MKHAFKRLSPLILFIFFTVSIPFVGFSQDNEVLPGNPPGSVSGGGGNGAQGGLGDPDGDVDPGCDSLDPTCPIDGGLSALLLLGAGYGVRKVRQARKSVDKV